MQSVITAGHREVSMRCIRALRSLSGNDQDRVLWKKAQISHHKYDKLCCAEERATVMLEKVPKCLDGPVLITRGAAGSLHDQLNIHYPSQ